MTITVLVSITGHMVIAGISITFFYYLVCIPFAFRRHLCWSWFFTWGSDPNLHSPRVWAISNLPDLLVVFY